MEVFFWRALTAACVVSAFLGVLLFPARRWLTGRYAPQVRWSLWRGMAALLLLGIFVAGFAALPATSWQLPAYAVTLPAAMDETPAQPADKPRSDLPNPGLPADSGETDAKREPVPSEEEQGPVAQSQASAAVTVPAASIAAAVWVTGAAGILLWQGIRYNRARRRLLMASIPTGAYEEMVGEMGVQASLRVLPGLESPMALGMFRPVVLLPEGEVPLLAVRHELTHLRRHDLAGKALLFLACALYWFDPLVWYMARVAGEDMEAACDAQLVRDMTAAEKRAYGELLLEAAAGGRAAALATRFGGSQAQMRSRLTQLFHPGKPSRTLAGILFCVVFLVMGLVACRSDGESHALDVENDVLYATFGYEDQPEGTDFRELTLDLVDFSPGADWVGGSYATVTLPVSEDVRLDGTQITGTEWDKQMLNFLAWPQLRSYFLPGTDDVIRLEVENGIITAMDWFEGVKAVGGVLWQDEDYGEWFPYVLRLPESWRDSFDTIAALGRDGQDRVTDYAVEFYRKGTEELLFTLEARQETEFRAQYGYDDDALEAQGIWLLGSGGGWCFCGKAAPSSDQEDGMMEDLLSQFGQQCLAWLGPKTYTSTRYGFTLTLPDSWQGHSYEEETLQGVDFYYRTDWALLCSLIVRTEPASQEELSTGRMKLAGSGNGWYVYLSMPQSVPANLFEDMAQGLRYQRMYQDFLRLLEENVWELTFAQGDDAVFPVLPPQVEPGMDTRAAFARVLRNLAEFLLLPDGTQMEPWALQGDLAENCFAVADVDGDGREEMVLYFTTASTADHRGMILGYDEDRGEIHIQLVAFPDMEFYENGAVKVLYSHNQIGGALWPYTLYIYDPETDSYWQEAIVYSWEKKIRAVNDRGEPFPDELDRSGAGVIYYVEPDGWNDSNPMDRADYLAWEREALGDSEQLTLQFLPLTEENIAAIENETFD